MQPYLAKPWVLKITKRYVSKDDLSLLSRLSGVRSPVEWQHHREIEEQRLEDGAN